MSGVSETLTALSMTVGRSAAAREVANLAHLRPQDLVVDVGCGPGATVREAGRRGTPAIGVDPSGAMVRLARRITSIGHSDRAEFVQGSAESLPLPTHSATVVWAVSSYHHWQGHSLGLSEAMRVLAPGGRLLIAERSVKPGARGHARHGLTTEEAELLTRITASTGFVDVSTQTCQAGRRTLVILTATTPVAG